MERGPREHVAELGSFRSQSTRPSHRVWLDPRAGGTSTPVYYNLPPDGQRSLLAEPPGKCLQLLKPSSHLGRPPAAHLPPSLPLSLPSFLPSVKQYRTVFPDVLYTVAHKQFATYRLNELRCSGGQQQGCLECGGVQKLGHTCNSLGDTDRSFGLGTRGGGC